MKKYICHAPNVKSWGYVFRSIFRIMHRRNNENIQWKPDIMTLNIISPTAIYGINKNSRTLTTSPYCFNVLLQSFKYTLTLNRHKRKWRPDIIVSTWLWNLSLDLLKPIHPSHKEQDTHRRRHTAWSFTSLQPFWNDSGENDSSVFSFQGWWTI